MNSTNRKNKKIIIVIAHIAAWTCFFLLPYILYPQQQNLPDIINKRIHFSVVIDDIFLVVLYYFNTLFLIPRLLFQQKNALYILINFACLFIFLFVPRYIVDFIVSPEAVDAVMQQLRPRGNNNHRPPPNESFRRNRFTFPISLYLLTYTVGTCIAVMQRWLQTERNKQEIENEKLNTELSFLRSQVNPHFFFNTLNNIYSLAVVKSEQTAPAVMKLSSIMRYILTESQTDYVSLQNEIDFIKNYIDLQLYRLTDKVKVHFNCSGNIEEKEITPLLFISFVENAFKYGVSTKESTKITIDLTATKTSISFHAVNSIVKADNGIHDTTGIGINNVKRRLELLYPHHHTLEVLNKGDEFIVHLDIFEDDHMHSS